LEIRALRTAFLVWGLVLVPLVAWYIGFIRTGRPLAVVLAIGLPALVTALAGVLLRRPAPEVVNVSLLSSGLVVLAMFLTLVFAGLGGGFDTAPRSPIAAPGISAA